MIQSRKLQFCLGLNRLIMYGLSDQAKGIVSYQYVHSKGFTYLKNVGEARKLMRQVLRS